jgi:hypothetical protein
VKVIIHRNIKLSKVRERVGACQVLDFGLARVSVKPRTSHLECRLSLLTASLLDLSFVGQGPVPLDGRGS